MPQNLPERTSSRRQPVSTLVAADLIGLFQGAATSAGIANGIWTSVVISPGPFSRVLPWVLVITVGVCIGCLWRMINHHIARETSLVRGLLWLLAAIVLWGLCVGTSGRFMCALVDGPSAIRDNENAYMREIGSAAAASEAREELDRPLIDIVVSDARNLRSLQDGERRFGTVSGKVGGKGVTDAIGREADAFDALTSNLKALDSRRSDYLAQADRQLADARSAIALNDETGFVVNTTAAARLLKQANTISLLDGVGGFGAGMVIDAARGPFEQAKREVDQFVASAREKQHDVSVPTYQSMPDKDAVMAYPPVLGWTFAVLLESFPVLAAAILLLSNLGGHKPMLAPAE